MCAIDGGLCHAWLAAIPFGGWLVAAGRCWWHSRKAGTKPQRPINPTLSRCHQFLVTRTDAEPINPTLSLSIDSTISRLFDDTFLESNEPDCDECGGDCYRNCQHGSNYRGSCCKRTELVEPDCDECGGDCTRTDADGRATDIGGYPLKGSDWRIVRDGEGEQS